MPARAVVFDLFGTLIDDSPPTEYAEFLAETARRLGAEPGHFRELWEAHDVARYTSPIEECFESICSELGVADFRLGMISNASSELSALWAASAFVPLFDAVLFSADERMMKPDRRLYERLTELLGVTAEHTLFVGDGA